MSKEVNCTTCKYDGLGDGICTECRGFNCCENKQLEMVNHPNHYNTGTIEVIDAIEDWKLNFSLGSAVKYIARADHKHSAIEDLKKAVWYVSREIERREKQTENDNRIKHMCD